MKSKFKQFKLMFFVLFVFFFYQFNLNCKETIKDERRFQLGFGFNIGTHSLVGMSEVNRIYNSINNNTNYYYPLAADKKAFFENLNSVQKTGILIGHIFGGWEYGFQFRMLWKIMIAEADMALIPFDASNNGRFDFIIKPMIGIRAPFALMPYIMSGMILTFSFYPGEYSFLESEKSNFISNEKFSIRPGLVIRAGLEFKIPKYLKIAKFSVGGYVQYTIKDLEEFNYIYLNYKNEGNTDANSVLKVLSYQINFGISLCYYIF